MVTRVAPSPTGFFHLGTLLIALLNYVKAKANNGTFILRIDDTDQERNKPEYITYIYDQMKEFGLDYDITFKQSERLSRYKEVAEKIGTKTDEGYILNMKSPTGEEYKMVILRNNGFPTYNFCSILDDYDYNVTDIIRGADHINNLPKQKSIWDMICASEGDKPFPNVSHMGLLFEGTKKLSKRSGNGTTADYQDINRSALLNWLFKFGWSHSDKNFDQKYPIMSIEDMIKLFNEGRVTGNNCKIDRQKLLFLDKKWKGLGNKKSKITESKILKYADFLNQSDL